MVTCRLTLSVSRGIARGTGPGDAAIGKVGFVPELPEVETFRGHLGATSLRKQIEEVGVKSSELQEGISVDALRSSLQGRRFESTRRHGKYLFVRLDRGGWLSYIIPHRHHDGTCPKRGRELESVKVSGRTAYYCPHHQQAP
jgi:formamidopyrimidine-DNA glycosylase